MANFIDYYKILGIDKTVDAKAIRKAFRKLARKYHPDVNPGDAEAERKFKEVTLGLVDILKDAKQLLSVGGKQLRVTIPAGVHDGQSLKLRGQGLPGQGGGPAGDLYITFKVSTPAAYDRKGADLYKEQGVDLLTMILLSIASSKPITKMMSC